MHINELTSEQLRHLDIEIGRKVMGWTTSDGENWFRVGDLGKEKAASSPWSPTRDGASMLLLMEHVKADHGYYFEVAWDKDEDAWHARWHDGQKSLYHGWGDTAPFALARCVAMAYGLELKAPTAVKV